MPCLACSESPAFLMVLLAPFGDLSLFHTFPAGSLRAVGARSPGAIRSGPSIEGSGRALAKVPERQRLVEWETVRDRPPEVASHTNSKRQESHERFSTMATMTRFQAGEI